MLHRIRLVVLIVVLVSASTLSLAIYWIGTSPTVPMVRTASTVQWTGERPWFPNYSSAVQISASASSNYSDDEIRSNLTLSVLWYWPLSGQDEFMIGVNLSTRHVQGTGTGTTLRLGTDAGSVSWDYADPSNFTSSGYDASMKSWFLILHSTDIPPGPLSAWWHLGGSPNTHPTLRGAVQVGYSVSGHPRILEFPVQIGLRQDSSPRSPLNVTMPFRSNAFIGDWDISDSYGFPAAGAAILEVDLSHLWVYNTSVNVTLFGPQGLIASETFSAGAGQGDVFVFRHALAAAGDYSIEIAASYPMFYQLDCAISP